MNKGSLGGVMALNGSVKFANSGFESWSGNDYISRDLGEPFMPTNSVLLCHLLLTFKISDMVQVR